MQTHTPHFRPLSALTSLTASILLLLGLVFLLLAWPKTADAAGFVVNTNADDSLAHDQSPGDGICADSLGDCPLRAAIEEANALPGTDTITFNEAMTITMDLNQSGLPALTGRTVIDASGVWDSVNNKPGVALDGNGLPVDGLLVSGGGSGVYGLIITNFGANGIYINSDNNTIGGFSVLGQPNVIINNGADGIDIWGSQAFNNIVHGNFIGIGVDGITARPNKNGILISSGAYSNTIGLSRFGGTHANLISGNIERGIIVEGGSTRDNFIAGNFIGSNLNGNTNVGNGFDGILIRNLAFNTRINNDTISSTPNYIVGNGSDGIALSLAGPNSIYENFIFSNDVNGISILNADHVEVQANKIYGNGQFGVYVFGAAATSNPIVFNNIYDNDDEGIKLASGGNTQLAAPVITNVNGQVVSGTSCASCIVEIFSDSADEGKIWEGWVLSNSSGQWSQTFPNPLNGPNLTATTTSPNYNTSEFSTPYSLNGGNFKIYLPAVLRG